MRQSAYFHDLCERYQAEIDDLRDDSEGRNVLQARLRDKRKAFSALLPMISYSPEMVASAFHGAFDFPAPRRAALHDLLQREPGEFLPWGELAQHIGIAGWAQPMIDQVLAEEGGEDFLSSTVGMEFVLSGAGGRGAPRRASADRHDTGDDLEADGSGTQAWDEDDGTRRAGTGLGNDDDSDEADDPDASGEDFLEDQGFDRRQPE